MGGAGDFDDDRAGHGSATVRRTDPGIAALVHHALGTAATVVNVGAGAGSYEPADRWVVAVEPSAAMRAQRPVSAAPVLAGVAEWLPFADGSFDAAMAMVTVHQRRDQVAGLRGAPAGQPGRGRDPDLRRRRPRPPVAGRARPRVRRGRAPPLSGDRRDRRRAGRRECGPARAGGPALPASGEWDRRYRALREQEEFVGALGLVVHHPVGRRP